MFQHFEQATEARVHTEAFASLTPTWHALLTKLRNTPIVLLPYERIPPLYESAMLQSLSEIAEVEYSYSICFDLTGSPKAHRDLFLVSSHASSPVSELGLQITKHLVESNSQARFVVILSTNLTAELRQHACYPLIERYVSEFSKIPQAPLSFLTQFSRQDSLPVYSERKLWMVLFYGVVLALEQAAIDEDQLREAVSGLRLVEDDKSRYAFYDWGKLPPGEMGLCYFRSLGFTDAERQLAKQDQSFYLAKCFRKFSELGLLPALQDVLSTPSQVGDQYRLMISLREETTVSVHHVKATQFWQELGIKYLLGEWQPPFQSIGPVSAHVRDDPVLRRAIEKIGRILGAPSPLMVKRNPVDAACTSFEQLYTIGASRQAKQARTIEDLLHSFLSEYERRLVLYDDTELSRLLLKTVNIALVTYACLSLHGEVLSNQGFGLFHGLWNQCFDQLSTALTLSIEQRTNMWRNLETLTLFDQRFQEAKRLFKRTEDIDFAIKEAERVIRAKNPVEAFLSFYADQLLEHDFFLDLHEWGELASPLARSYSELDKQLLLAHPPYSLQHQRRYGISNLVSTAGAEMEYDRVFLLIIDSLSYLEWKLIRSHFENLKDEEIRTLEQYAFAPVPTYTPANTTCLITGYEPSEIGVCDWRIKPLGQRAVDINDSKAKPIILNMGQHLNPRNTLTLVHNQTGTNLTRLWLALANIEQIPIQISNTRKAIAQVRDRMYQLNAANKVVVVYISDFDHAGHWHLQMDGWAEYYSLLARGILNSLLLPIFRRARQENEKTLVILTADHGKLSRYESKMLGLSVAEVGTFGKCVDILNNYEMAKSARHLVAWVPDSDIDSVKNKIERVTNSQRDVVACVGQATKRFFPHVSRTNLMNPNVIILSRFDLRGGGAMGHGAGSMSEVAVPAIRFSWG